VSGNSPVETSTTAAGADVGAAASGADELLPGEGVDVCDDALDAVELALLDPHPAARSSAAIDITMDLLTTVNLPREASPVASAVLRRRWSTDRYGRFIAETMIAALFP
jgi:hypothetical protein